MARARAQLTIEKSADDVWAAVGDFADLSWIPNAMPTQLVGTTRTFELNGRNVTHHLLRHDDAARCYTYALGAGNAVDPREHVRATEATISVVPSGPCASTVTWTCDTDQRTGSSEGLSMFFRTILDHLKTELERT